MTDAVALAWAIGLAVAVTGGLLMLLAALAALIGDAVAGWRRRH